MKRIHQATSPSAACVLAAVVWVVAAGSPAPADESTPPPTIAPTTTATVTDEADATATVTDEVQQGALEVQRALGGSIVDQFPLFQGVTPPGRTPAAGRASAVVEAIHGFARNRCHGAAMGGPASQGRSTGSLAELDCAAADGHVYRPGNGGAPSRKPSAAARRRAPGRCPGTRRLGQSAGRTRPLQPGRCPARACPAASCRRPEVGNELDCPSGFCDARD